MKAVTKCHKCCKTLETEDMAEIEQNESFHKCRDGLRIVKVKWKVFPQEEKAMDSEELNDFS